jgi:hypothetical protein
MGDDRARERTEEGEKESEEAGREGVEGGDGDEDKESDGDRDGDGDDADADASRWISFSSCEGAEIASFLSSRMPV